VPNFHHGLLGQRALAQNLPARVDATALRQRIEALSMFGRPSGGAFADGVSRVAYSDADVAGREKLARLAERIRLRAAEIARETKTSIEFTSSSHNAPANAAVEVQRAIERSAGRLGLMTQRMPSGAGHDAQMMAQLSPMGMIFVPSVGGISHSPRELTHWDDCARGADVLLGTVLEMDRV
jgi:acetylornithine deacetylase/succinyl-diaminopimelate desuccinylase-like protein